MTTLSRSPPCTRVPKTMSWRKPVPKYIPSPPPSPPPSTPASPFTRLSTISLGSAMNNSDSDMPPLPLDWRQTIERAVANDDFKSQSSFFESGTNQLPSSVGRKVPPIIATNANFMEEADIGEFGRNVDTYEMKLSSSFRRTVSNLPSPMCSSAPRSPTIYRPPTPPLRSHKKVHSSESRSSLTLLKPGAYVYPDIAGLGETNHTPTAPTCSDSSTCAAGISGSNLARHTLPLSVASWLSLKIGSMDTATLFDEESTLPAYYRKPSTDSTFVVIDYSHTQSVWQVIKSWSSTAATKVRGFCSTVASIWH